MARALFGFKCVWFAIFKGSFKGCPLKMRSTFEKFTSFWPTTKQLCRKIKTITFFRTKLLLISWVCVNGPIEIKSSTFPTLHGNVLVQIEKRPLVDQMIKTKNFKDRVKLNLQSDCLLSTEWWRMKLKLERFRSSCSIPQINLHQTASSIDGKPSAYIMLDHVNPIKSATN